MLVLIFVAWALPTAAKSEADPHMIVHLLDYIATDYNKSVENGQVVNAYEYSEMQDFVSSVKQLITQLPASHDQQKIATVAQFADSLGSLVAAKASPQLVAQQAQNTKIELIEATGLVLSPGKWPNLDNGAMLYQQNCLSCHGPQGAGDGPSALGLSPAPTNFTDLENMQEKSPLQAFHTIRFGVDGTSMQPFHQLRDDEIWDLAFYISTLRNPTEGLHTDKQLTLEDLATLSDTELMAKYQLTANEVAAARRVKPQVSSEKPLDRAQDELQKVVQFAQNKQYKEAKHAALNSYLEGIEPVEVTIKSQDPKLVQEIEIQMGILRKQIDNMAAPADIDAQVLVLQNLIEEGKQLLASSESSFWMTFSLSASIILREGLEAFLIIIIIISVLQKAQAKKAIAYVHSGWLSAVGLGLVGWFFADWLLNMGGLQRELLEGLVAIFAVVVLFFIGFWMHSKSEAKKWNDYVKNKIQKLLTKQSMFGLAALAFIVVFREAFESVLFLSAIGLEDNNQFQGAIGLGVLAAFVVVAILGVLMMRFSKRLPVSQLFKFSALIIAVLSIVLMGKGVHAVQESGYLSITASPLMLRVGMLGIYPTLETIIAQVLMLVITVFAWKYQQKLAARA